MSDLIDLNLSAIRDGLVSGTFTSLEVTDAFLTRIEAGKELNCYIQVTGDKARSMAKAADTRITSKKAGPLEGVPLGIKDLFCTKGIPTTAASHILEGFTPTYESTVSANLFRDGAVMLGKLNLDEFAMGSSNETSYFGNVINPWQRHNDTTPLTPGGSSGGSAAAVAARLCAGATATDTGGSIRQPAAFTGTVGLKPTYGRCSRWGTIAFASSLDQAGPLTRTVRDAAIMLRSMAGPDAKDSTCLNVPVPDYESGLTNGVKGVKIGIPREFRMENMPAEIDALWQKGVAWLQDAGAEVIDVSLPLTKYALPAYYIIAPAEASSNLARYDGVRYGLRVEDRDIDRQYEKTRGKGFGDEVIRRILIGTYVLSAGYYDAYYLHAQKVRKRIFDEYKAVFQSVDLLLTPSTPSAAFGLGEKSDNLLEMYLNDIFTVTGNLAGLPGISIPAGLSAQGLPLGLQLLGKPLDEATLLRAAHTMEHAAGFDQTPTDWWKTGGA